MLDVKKILCDSQAAATFRAIRLGLSTVPEGAKADTRKKLRARCREWLDFCLALPIQDGPAETVAGCFDDMNAEGVANPVLFGTCAMVAEEMLNLQLVDQDAASRADESVMADIAEILGA